MHIKDQWIYQKRNVAKPWSIYFVYEYDRHKPTENILDWTLYHEDIPNRTQSKTFAGLHHSSIDGYANAIITELLEYCEVEASDYSQIEHALQRLMF